MLLLKSPYLLNGSVELDIQTLCQGGGNTRVSVSDCQVTSGKGESVVLQKRQENCKRKKRDRCKIICLSFIKRDSFSDQSGEQYGIQISVFSCFEQDSFYLVEIRKPYSSEN